MLIGGKVQQVFQNQKKAKQREAKSYTSLECYELVKKGQREAATSRVSRIDNSSVKTHKARWHKNNEKSTMVPTDSSAVVPQTSKVKNVS